MKSQYGHPTPAGVILHGRSSQNLSQHILFSATHAHNRTISRNPDVWFPNPDQFDPRWWLDTQDQIRTGLKFYPYSHGRRYVLYLFQMMHRTRRCYVKRMPRYVPRERLVIDNFYLDYLVVPCLRAPQYFNQSRCVCWYPYCAPIPGSSGHCSSHGWKAVEDDDGFRTWRMTNCTTLECATSERSIYAHSMFRTSCLPSE